MPRQLKGTDGSTAKAATGKSKKGGPGKPWGMKTSELPKYVMDDLYQVYQFLDKQTRKRLGLMMEVPVFIQDPQVARGNPSLCIQEVEVRLEAGMSDGPTSSRIAVVDFNADSQKLIDPVAWDRDNGWFRSPGEEGAWLAEVPSGRSADEAAHREFIDQAVKNPYFHQVNVWAVVQRVLEFYEDPQALGRPVPWGFDGNRLMVVPHAGYGENAFYDQNSKSLQFYYFGDQNNPGYTCLSHDIIAHETGHAILDGIRPLYNQPSSVQTAAFHEFIGDLTAILLGLFNNDIRRHLAKATEGDIGAADMLANLAEEFGTAVEERPYLRSATNTRTMREVQGSLSPHAVSEVLTGAMFEILKEITKKRMEGAARGEATEEAGEAAEGQGEPRRKITPAQAWWRTADRFRRIALQPLDLCPPCDIQFVDYASAVIRNDVLTNPVDEQGYREVMLQVFHRRGLCPCQYQQGQALPDDCLFTPAYDLSRLGLRYHDIGRVSRSRTAAYYFLSDNRKVLRIPAHQDVVVADLYDNSKFGAAAERLPREIVLEYLWQEAVKLDGAGYGRLNGKTVSLNCGGTLVFDERGNLLSWFRKPGTEHLEPAGVEAMKQRLAEWQENPEEARRNKVKPLTQQEAGELDDYQAGLQRKEAFKGYIAAVVRRGLVGEPQPGNPFMEGLKPLVAMEENGTVRFEMTPHLRKSDFDTEVEGWAINY